MENLENGYALATIDGNEYTMNVFSELGVNDIMLSAPLKLTGGDHTITLYRVFDENDVLIYEDDTTTTFKVEVSKTFELPVVLTPITAAPAGMKMKLSMEGYDHGFMHGKGAEAAPDPDPDPPPPQPELKIVNIIGLLGIPENEIEDYKANSQYGRNPVSSFAKCIFSVQHSHNGEPATHFQYDYYGRVPLELRYTKSGNPEDVDTFKIQCLRRKPDGSFAEFLSTYWMITLQGDEDFVLNEGVVEFSMFPTIEWESDFAYKMTYQ